MLRKHENHVSITSTSASGNAGCRSFSRFSQNEPNAALTKTATLPRRRRRHNAVEVHLYFGLDGGSNLEEKLWINPIGASLCGSNWETGSCLSQQSDDKLRRTFEFQGSECEQTKAKSSSTFAFGNLNGLSSFS